jgi:hypothetical protein
MHELLAHVFEVLLGGWSVGVLMFLWAIERRLAELAQLFGDTDHGSCPASPLKPPG